MEILYLDLPGSSIVYEERAKWPQVQHLFSEIQKSFATMQMSCEAYNTARLKDMATNKPDYPGRSITENLRQQIRDKIAKETQLDWFRINDLETRKLAMQEAESEGFPPEMFLNATVSMHASTFVHAVHMTNAYMQQLNRMLGNTLSKPIQEFNQYFSGVKGVRDSLSHADERAMGKGKGGKAIQPEVFNYGGVQGNLTTGGSHFGSTFIVTDDEGKHQAIDISQKTLLESQRLIQSFINALPWEGHPGIWPSA